MINMHLKAPTGLQTEMEMKSDEQPAQSSPAEARNLKQPRKTAGTTKTDSGWAWVVMLGSFMAYFTSIGFTVSLSVYLTIWMDHFNTSAVTAGLVISIGILMRGIMSPVSGALCSKFGHRVVTVVGGVILVTGAIMSSQAPTIGFLIFSNGFVAAAGGSMVYVAAVHVLGIYFKKKFAFAVGFASAGISAAQLAFPALVTYLIDVYGWRGSMLVTAAINLHLLAAGALMRPIVKKRQKRKRSRENSQQKTGQDQVHMIENVSRVGDKTNYNNTAKHTDEAEGNMEVVSSCGSYNEQTDGSGVAIIITNLFSDSAELINEGDGRPTERAMNPFLVSVAEDGITPSDLIQSVIVDEPDPALDVSYFSRLKIFLLDTYGLRRLAHNTRFVLTIIVAFSHGFGKLGIIYIVARAKSLGIDLNHSALLLSIFGAGSTVSRIGHGWFIDKKYITAEMAYALALLAFCVAVSLSPAFNSFTPLVVLAVLLGTAAGVSASVVIVIVRAQVQQSDAAEALGIMILFMSVGNVVGVLVSGVTYDTTESYDVAFFTAGAILLVASMLSVTVYFLQRAKHSRHHLPPTMLYVKLPRKFFKEKRVQSTETVMTQPDSEVKGSRGGDQGIVNPVYMMDVGEVSTNVEVTGDNRKDSQQAPDLREKKHFTRRRFGRKGEIGEIGGFENPMMVDQVSFNRPAGEDAMSEVDESESLPENTDRRL